MVDATDVSNPNDPLITAISNWIAAKYSCVQEAKKSRGGWEVWAQLELLFLLGPGFGQQHTLVREQDGIWPGAPGQRIDFWFTFPGQPIVNWGVELKCRSTRETHNNFLNRFLLDFQKCMQVLPQNTTAAMYAIGITNDPADWGDYAQWPNTYRHTIPGPSKNAGSPIFLIWRRV
ncbi:hypothetical protein MMC26_006773 [Xylographa opegraphella]|nr:hypothetical protein [Xylographa opegraphella]